METLIIYLSKHGTAQKASRLIQKFLSPDNNVTTINLSHDNVPELSNYDRIIIGTSIYVGKGRRSFAKFCTNEYINLFAHKDLGLFLCGLEEDYQKQQKIMKTAQLYINDNFNAEFDYRFDIIEVFHYDDNKVNFNHLKGAFEL